MKNRSQRFFGGPVSVVLMSVVPMFSIFLASAANAQLTMKQEARPPGIMLQTTDDGVVYADKNGMTIYTSEMDQKRGQSSCTSAVRTHGQSVGGDIYAYPNQERLGSCLSHHPIVSAEGAKPLGQWTIIDRPDGLKQWAYAGRPLYTSIKDFRPGQVNGTQDGQGGPRTGGGGGPWRPARPPFVVPPEVRIGNIGAARVLVTSRDGRTLYTAATDANVTSSKWQPLVAPTIAKEQGGWTVVKRADSVRQWALQGKPLYTYADDVYVADYKGDSEPGWDVALTNPLPKTPDTIQVVHTILGPRYADSKGTTLYVFSCNAGVSCDNPGDRSNWWTTDCGGNETKCADVWRPYLADENAKPAGTMWSIVPLQEPWAPVRAAHGQAGKKAWAYRGKPVFTFKYEDRPAMIEGEDIGVLGTQKWYSLDAEGYDINQSQLNMRAASR